MKKSMCALALMVSMACGCRTSSLESVEAEVSVPGKSVEVLRTAVIIGAMDAAMWKPVEIQADNVRIDFSRGKFAISTLVHIYEGGYRIEVVSAQGLRFTRSANEIHKRACGWLMDLRNSISRAVASSDRVYEVKSRVISVASGVKLGEVICAVCKSHGLMVSKQDSNCIRAVGGQGPEKLILDIPFEAMSFSLLHCREKDAKTNGFQYDLVVRDIESEIIRYADPVSYEARVQRLQTHEDNVRLANELRNIGAEIRWQTWNLRNLNETVERK